MRMTNNIFHQHLHLLICGHLDFVFASRQFFVYAKARPAASSEHKLGNKMCTCTTLDSMVAS
jgi:hypothetical protein